MPTFKKARLKAPNGSRITVRYSRFFPPYFKKNGRDRTTLNYITKACCGVYIIRSKQTKKILYVGFSGKDLYKTLYRHFQSWEDPKQYRTTYANKYAYEIMVVLHPNPNIMFMLEQYYIDRLKPRDTMDKSINKKFGFSERPISREDLDFSGAIPRPSRSTAYKPMELSEVPF
ncbi:MAG: GIY-YIG nuclease family protein [Bacteroidota bacterium]